MDFLIGLLLSIVIAFMAYRKKSLDTSGFISATVVGTLLYVFGTYILFSLLIFFFISSSIFTKIKTNVEDKKGRSAVQVLANSLMALIFSIAFYITSRYEFLYIGGIAIAASTSDTWASEIGKLSKGKVFSILNFKMMDKGESGGISILGLFASFVGSFIISILFILLLSTYTTISLNDWWIVVVMTIGGLLGSILDSYLGILIQEKYIDHQGHILEKVKSRKIFKKLSGISFINNDFVNFLMTFIITLLFSLILIK